MDKDKHYFKASPFSLLASKEAAACWAGRRDVHRRLEKICKVYGRRTDSSLDLIWANLGSGKTHALYHLEYLLANEFKEQSRAVVAFVEMPESIRHFTDMYKRIIASLPLETIADIVLKSDNGSCNTNLYRASNAMINGGNIEKSLAKDWLLGGHVHLRDLKTGVGIDARIEDDVTAGDILGDIISACGSNDTRFVVLLDEFQRIGVLPKKQREMVLSNLRSIFSRNPSHLSMVMAVGSRIEQTARDFIPPELRTLMGVKQPISLPEMDAKEAVDYILERFRCFRPDNFDGSDEEPFARSVLEAVVEYLDSNDNAKLIPRTMQQVLADIYDEIIDSPDFAVSVEEVKTLLRGFNWDE